MDDSIKDRHEDRITTKDLLQANVILIEGILIFITLFKDLQIISIESIAFFALAVFGFLFNISIIIHK